MSKAALCVILLALFADAGASSSSPYFTPKFAKGESYTDIYSKTIAITGTGFDPIVLRGSGSSTYVVTDVNLQAVRFDETDVTEGHSPSPGQLEIRDAGNTYCFNRKCSTNNQTSGLAFMPLLWGTPPDTIRAGTTWNVTVSEPWEIGPPGIETVTVISLDPSSRMVVLQRAGHGIGASSDDASGLRVTVDGKTFHATVDPGPSQWSGQVVLRGGIVVSDEILLKRPLTLASDLGTFSGTERVYTLLTAAPRPE